MVDVKPVKTTCAKKKLSELKEECKKNSIKGFSSMKKNDLVLKCCENFLWEDLEEKIAIIKDFVIKNVETGYGVSYKGIKYELDPHKEYSATVMIIIDEPYERNIQGYRRNPKVDEICKKNDAMIYKIKKMFPTIETYIIRHGVYITGQTSLRSV